MNVVLDGVVVKMGARTIGPWSATWGPGLHHLRGGNGSGKTTLLRAACGELRPAAGRVTVDGRSPGDDPGIRARIAFLPAVPELSDFLRVREAWSLMAALRGRPTWDGRALEADLELDGSAPLSRLSVGQRRKAELLAALAGDPDVLLLDEVLAPLDVATVTMLGRWIDAWRATRVIVLTAHGGLDVTPDHTWDLPPGRPAQAQGAASMTVSL
jgi:ABC-2 type transport system ATP-binding protein